MHERSRTRDVELRPYGAVPRPGLAEDDRAIVVAAEHEYATARRLVHGRHVARRRRSGRGLLRPDAVRPLPRVLRIAADSGRAAVDDERRAIGVVRNAREAEGDRLSLIDDAPARAIPGVELRDLAGLVGLVATDEQNCVQRR